MNIPETEIENLLRAAPKPPPPAWLKERLMAEMQLPGVGQASRPSAGRFAREATEAGGTPTPLHPRGWLRRWWPALAPAAVSLACAALVAVQQLEINDLKETIRVLTPAALATETAPNTGIVPAPPAAPTLDASASEQAEIARLKAVAGRLTAEIARLEQIHTENQKLRARIAAPPANVLAPEEFEALVKARDRATSIACVNNMKQLGLAARLWALDNHDTYPETILSMTNEMSTPKILWCPGEAAGQAAKGWADFTAANCSYEYLAASGSDREPDRVLFRCPIHGNISLCDGSVQRGIGKTHPERLVTREGKLHLENGTPPAKGTAPLNNANP